MDADASNQIQNSTAKSELDKMLDGEYYLAFDPDLVAMRKQAKQVCFEFNQTSPLKVDRRQALIEQLLGRSDAIIESPFNCDYGCHLQVGKNFYANHGCTILDCARITIGDNCLLAPGVVISSAYHPMDAEIRARGLENALPIVIGDNAWIGSNATINPGVVLGSNVVVGAGAVVTKNFPDNVVVAGVPAKIIRHLTTTTTTTTNDDSRGAAC